MPSATAAKPSEQRLRRDAEQQQAREDQAQAAEQHGLVAEARDEHAGRHVEQQHAEAAQADDERRERGARADLEHVERQQDRQRFLAHGHQQRRHVDRQQQTVVWSRQASFPVAADRCAIRLLLDAVIGDGLPLRSTLPFSVPSARELGHVVDSRRVAVEHDVVAPLRARAVDGAGEIRGRDARDLGLAAARQRVARLDERARDDRGLRR